MDLRILAGWDLQLRFNQWALLGTHLSKAQVDVSTHCSCGAWQNFHASLNPSPSGDHPSLSRLQDESSTHRALVHLGRPSAQRKIPNPSPNPTC